MKIEYARNLPHIQYVGAIFFVMFCLKGSLPAAVVQELIAERDPAEVKLKRIINYTVQNPVKAGLVNDWQDWPNTYLSERV
ncbi:hypothetical protein [Spirosoma sp.]|uniref:hypothetical protein n=1 Tax=Spirosoma sp. TaxID=1899569 RepID=UPI002637C5ED|nr:hypothetical protein [Spirosoma sp.]MCX6213113.1 hypothetical protein [Spirosoma sp.]